MTRETSLGEMLRTTGLAAVLAMLAGATWAQDGGADLGDPPEGGDPAEEIVDDGSIVEDIGIVSDDEIVYWVIDPICETCDPVEDGSASDPGTGEDDIWPVEEIVVEETPIDETPIDETPVDESPVDETPIDETPVDDSAAGDDGATDDGSDLPVPVLGSECGGCEFQTTGGPDVLQPGTGDRRAGRAADTAAAPEGNICTSPELYVAWLCAWQGFPRP